jgi:transcriptional regulator with XRE-family HTH domain
VDAWKRLGSYLLAARSKQGLTHKDLASRTGLDPSHISLFERDVRRPSLEQLVSLAGALSVPLQWLLTGANEPGIELPDMAVQLRHLGVVDLFVPTATVPGAFRPAEEIVALVVSGDRPEPRLVEAVPAVLAWNPWDVRLLEAYGQSHDPRAAPRLAWLAEAALRIHERRGFPGGLVDSAVLSAFAANTRPSQECDSLGRPTLDGDLPPLWKRRNITYAADLETFRHRAEHLQELREALKVPSRRRRPVRERDN